MPLGTTVPDEHGSVFEIRFHHAFNDGVPIGAVLVTVGDGNATVEDVEEVAQDLVDLISGSTDFVFDSASKSFPSEAVMTPTT